MKSFKKSLRIFLKQISSKFYCYTKKVLEFKDIEDVHQMRVYGRRLLAFMNILVDSKHLKKKKFSKLKTTLKKAMAILGKLRDTDVLIGEMERRSQTFSIKQKKCIEGWLKKVLCERNELQGRLSIELPRYLDRGWKACMRVWIEREAAKLADKDFIRAEIWKLTKRKRKAIKAIRKYPNLDMADRELLERVHEGRISVKNLRYALDLFNQLKGVHGKEDEALKIIQEKLGGIHDMQIWIERLREHAGKSSEAAKIIKQWREEMLGYLKSVV